MTVIYLLAMTAACTSAAGVAPAHRLSVSLAPLSFQAPDTPGVPLRTAPHRFFDRPNLVLTAIESGALLADGATTQRALHRYPGFAYEADPLARPFVSHGWPGEVAAGTIVVASDVAVRYLLHRTGHHRIERWIPAMAAALCTTAAIHNAWLMDHLARASPSVKEFTWPVR